MPATSLLRRHVTSLDPDATSALGASLAAVARAGDLLCLWGDLGAGKTHLAKAFGAALGVRETITSPSFVLMAEYEGRLPMFHVDLYRLADAADVLAGGLLDDRWVGGSRSSSGPNAWARRSRPNASTSSSRDPATTRARSS